MHNDPVALRDRALSVIKKLDNKPFRVQALARNLMITSKNELNELRRIVHQLEDEGRLARAGAGQFRYSTPSSNLIGVFERRGKRGQIQNDRGGRWLVPERFVSGFLPGDQVAFVEIGFHRASAQAQARPTSLVARETRHLAGELLREGQWNYVRVSQPGFPSRVYVDPSPGLSDMMGCVFEVSIDRYEPGMQGAEGAIIRSLGKGSDPAVRREVDVIRAGLPLHFPPAVVEEADALETTRPADTVHRSDFRSIYTITIDPADARDHDDAISIEPTSSGWTIHVHIADVSSWVTPGSALDEEARTRGNSVYLVDRVIPMLPEVLSADLCSLRAREDRLTYTCVMEVTPAGDITRYAFEPSIIHCDENLSYEDAQTLIDGSDRGRFPRAKASVEQANALAQRWRRDRLHQGGIDFDLDEPLVVLDDQYDVVSLGKRPRLAAHQLIEEFMLQANRCAADALLRGGLASEGIYRVHEPPDTKRILELGKFVRAAGHAFSSPGGRVSSRMLNALIEDLAGTSEQMIVKEAMLRAMAKATYAAVNTGHYGLGFERYTHFTSPIRRYADLLVHRMLRALSNNGEPPYDKQALVAICEHVSERERNAIDAERASITYHQLRYMQEKLGETFEGTVRSAMRLGLFVVLDDLMVSGLVPIRDLSDDYYEVDPLRFALVGKHSGRAFKPGDRVTVTVARVDIEQGELDLHFAQ